MWRRTTIANQVTLSDTEVWEYALPTSGVLNACFLQLLATNGATSNLEAPLEACVNAVQLVDGGRVLMELTGPQCQIVSMLGAKGEPRSIVSEGDDDVQTYQALVPFGMHLYDEVVGLDLSKLRSPRLRVDVDLTSVRAVGATGFVTGSGRLSAVLIVNDGADAPRPETYLKSHEIKRWTTAGSGDELTQAPIDGPWARLIVRAHVANSNPDDVLTDIRVTFDSGQFVAIDERTRWSADSWSLFMGRLPEFSVTVFHADTDTHDLRHGGIDWISAHALVDTNVIAPAAFEAGRPLLNFNVLGAGTTQATDGDIYLDFRANHPYMSFVYDFIPMGNLDVSPYSRGDIILTQGVSAAAASLVLQQMMPNVLVA